MSGTRSERLPLEGCKRQSNRARGALVLHSGLRLGTPALTTRGKKEEQMKQVAELLDRVMGSNGNEAVCAQVREEVRGLCADFPMPH